jgi:hypothetical protein
MSRTRLTRGVAGTVLLTLMVGPAGAIVGRHDRDDDAYVQLGKEYRCVCRVARDGQGVLIGPHWVLTAAHVAQPVTAGKDVVHFGDRDFRVKRVVIHPGGHATGDRPPEDDVALLELQKAVKHVRPAQLYREHDEVGKTIVVAGYGDVGDGRSKPRRGDGRLRAARNVITEAGPKRIFFTFDAPPAGDPLEGVSGPGDSGGPALYEQDGRLYTVGISQASANGRPGRYGVTEVYMRVSSYVDWIAGVVGPDQIASSQPSRDAE